jgi:hypothetical protein
MIHLWIFRSNTMTDARELTLALGGKWYPSYGTAPCPVCQSEGHREQNALTLADGQDGRLLLNCKKSACAFIDILAATGVTSGSYRAPDPETLAKREAKKRAEDKKRALQAKQVWREAIPIGDTVAETYLRGRGITCSLPDTLRFHPQCWHGSTAKRYPAMVAAVQGNLLPAVHRTYLRSDGSGKADIEPAKAMLGATTGAAVRLSEGDGPLVVSEGIETALSLSSGLLNAPATVWAGLSTSGIRGLHLPHQARRLTIAPDGDQAGREAASALAERASALGWQVSLLPAPEGLDWNDVLTMKGEAA